jgi:5-(carboxyamino)imidazole ribonucleotide mutase
MTNLQNSKVGIIMGSNSDLKVMKAAAEILKEFDIEHEMSVVSAHRTPEAMMEYAKNARASGFTVIIAGAGGAAHLPGMVASMTALPVLGVPVESKALSGMDSLLSIVQMPGGIPVGTLAIGTPGAKNAGIMAASIIALQDDKVAKKLDAWRAKQTADVPEAPTGR